MFEVLASSSAGNAYLVRRGASVIGIEAGIPYRQYQKATGFKTTSLEFVLIGHEHGDHSRCAKDLVKAGVDVYATPGTIDALKLQGHRVHPLRMMTEKRLGDWTVLPFPAVHDAAEPCGFLVDYRQEYRLLYLSDSAFSAYRFAGLTEIAVEANFSLELLLRRVEQGQVESVQAARVIRNHLSLERCVELLQANDLSRVVTITLLHLSSSNSHAEHFKEAVQRATGKPVRVAAEREGIPA